MKLRKKIILSSISLIATFFAVLFGVDRTNVYAGTVAPYVDVTYETYLLSDYEKKAEWGAAFSDYIYNGVYAGTWPTPTAVGAYLIDQTALASDIQLANDCWDGTDSSYPIMVGTKTAYQYFGGYPFDLLSAVGVTDVKLNAIASGRSKKIDPDNPFYEDYEIVSQTKEFSPNDKIVIVEYVQGDVEYRNVAAALDLEFLSATQTTPFSKATSLAASPSAVAATTAYAWNPTNYDVKPNKFVASAVGDFYDTTGASISQKRVFVGGGGTAIGSNTYTTKDVSFALCLQVDANANGEYVIQPSKSNQCKFVANPSYSAGYSYHNDPNQNDHWNITPLTVKVNGASNKTHFSSLTVDGRTCTVSASDVPYEDYTQVAGGTAIAGGTTYYKVAGANMIAATFASSATTIPTDTQYYTKSTTTGTDIAATTAAATVNADIIGTVDSRGTVLGVKYFTSTSTTSSSAALALGNTSTTALPNAAATGYTVSQYNPGTTMYAAITTQSQDKSKVATYIIKIVRDKYNLSEMQSIGFAVTGSAVTTATLYDSSGGTTFTGNVSGNYTLKIPGDATDIDVTPRWITASSDASNYMTATVNGATATDGVTQRISASLTSFTVTITSQDGNVTRTFTITVQKLSADNTIVESSSYVKPSNTSSSTTINLDDPSITKVVGATGDVTYTIPDTLVKYGFTKFELKLNATNANAKVKIATDATQNSSATKSGIAFNALAPSNYNADTGVTVTATVTSESGAVKNYTFVVKKAAASTDASLTNIEAYDAANALIGLDNPFADGTSAYTSASDVAFGSTGFYVKTTVNDSTATVTYSYGGASLSGTAQHSSNVFKSQTALFSGGATATDTKVITITVKAENPATAYQKTYTVTINKAAADNDSSWSIVVTDNLGNVITGSLNSATNTWTTSANISKEADYVIYTITPTKSTSKVYLGSVAAANDISGVATQKNLTIPNNGIAGTTTVSLKVTTEATPSTGVNISYTLKFNNNPRDIDYAFAATSGVEVTGAVDSISYPIDSTTSTATTLNYEVTKSTNAPGYKYKLTIKLNNANAKVFWATSSSALAIAPYGGNPYGDFSSYASGFTGTLMNNTTTNEWTESFSIGVVIYVRVVSEYALYNTNATPQNSETYTINVKATDERDTDNVITGVGISGNAEITGLSWTFSAGTANQATIVLSYDTSAITFKVYTQNDKSRVHIDKTSISTSGTSPTLSSDGTTLSNCLSGKTANISLDPGDNYIYIQCESEKDTYNAMQYVVKVTRTPAATDDLITSLSVGGVSYTSSIGQTMIIKVTASSPTVQFTISNFATCSAQYTIGTTTSTPVTASPLNVNGIGYGSANGGYALVEIKVLAQSATSMSAARPYSIYLIYADDDASITDMHIFDSTGSDLLDVNGNTYTYAATPTTIPFTIPFSSDNPDVQVTTNSSFAHVTGDGVKTIAKGTTVKTGTSTVVVTSDFYDIIDGISALAGLKSNYSSQKLTYTFNFKRNAASQDRAVTATMTFGGGAKDGITVTITDGMTVEDLGALNTIKLVVTPTNANAPITYAFPPDVASCAAGVDSTVNITLQTNPGSTTSYTLTVYSESDTAGIAGVTPHPVTYRITLAYGSATLNSDASMRSIIVKADNGVTYLTNLTAGTYGYPLNVPGTVSSVEITISPNQNTTTAELAVDSNAATSVSINTALPYTLNTPTASGASTKFTIELTAQDGTKAAQKYVITINQAAVETINTISNLKINGNAVSGFNPSQTSGYNVNVVYSVTDASASFTLDGTAETLVSNNAEPSTPLALNVGTNTVTIVVKSEAGVTNTYTVNVIRDGDTNLTALELYKSTDLSTNLVTSFAAGNPNYSVTPDLAYTDSDVIINATQADSTNVTMTITYGTANTLVANGGTITLPEGLTTTIKIVLTPASGASNAKTYTVTVKRKAGGTDATIDSYVKEDGTTLVMVNNKFGYEYDLPRSYALGGSFNPTFTTTDPNATYVLPTVTTFQAGLNTMVISVTSENTSVTKQYTFKIYVVDNDPTINDIKLNDGSNGSEIKDSTGNICVDFSSGSSWSATIPFTVKTLSLNISLASSYSVIYVNNQLYTNNSVFNPAVGNNTYKIYALSEYGQVNNSATGAKSTEYTITVVRNAASSVATLSNLKVLNGSTDLITTKGTPNVFASGTQSYIIQDIGNTITGITISATATDPNATVVGTGSKILQSLSGSGASATGYMFAYDVVVTAEDGTTTITYSITLSRGQLNLDDDNTINYIIVKDSSGASYLDQLTFDPSQISYGTYLIPYGTQSVTIEVGKLAASPSTISIGGSPASTNSRQIAVTQAMINTTESYVVYATSQNGADGTKYTITLKFQKAEENTALAVLTVDGVSVKGFNAATDKEQQIYNYTLDQLPNTKNNVLVTAIGAKPEAQTITINSQAINPYAVNLNEGYNQIVVVVRAESGAQATYVITLIRAYSDPIVVDLEVEGYDLLNSNDKATTFNAKNTVYHAVVPYMSSSVVTIKVVVDNSNYVVSTSSTYNPVHNGTVWNFSTYMLSEGANYFTITVTSAEGATINYTLVIYKRGNDSVNTNLSLIRIAEIPAFESDYKNSETSYGVYKVGNDISDLTFTIVTEINASATGAGATYKIFNDKNLKVGNNKVVVVIIAEDGQTSRTIIIDVERAEMQYTVDESVITASGYTTTPTTTKNCYKVDLGTTKLSTIPTSTFTNAITSTTNPNLKVEVLSDLKDDTLNEVLVKVSDGYTNEFVRFVLEKADVDATVTPGNGTYPTTPSTTPTSGGIFASEYTIDLGEDLPTKLTLADFQKYFNSSVTVSIFNPTVITASTTEVDVAVTDGLNTSYVKFKLTHSPLVYTVDKNATSYNTIMVSQGVYEIDLGHDLPTVLQPAIMKSYITYDATTYRAITVNVDTIVNISTSEIYVTVSNNYESETVKFMIKRAPVDLTVDLTATDYVTTADATLSDTYTINLGEDLPTTKISANYLKRYFTGANLTVTLLNPIVITATTTQVVVSVTDGNSTGTVTFLLTHNPIAFTVDVNATGYDTVADPSGAANKYVIDLGDKKPTVLTNRAMQNYIITAPQVKTLVTVVGTITTSSTEIVLRVYNLYNEEVFVTFELEHTPLSDLYSVDTAATSYTTVQDTNDPNTYIIDLKKDAPTDRLSKSVMLGYILPVPTSTEVKTEVLDPIGPNTTEIRVKVSDNYDSEIITFKLQRNDVDSTPDVTKGDYPTSLVSGEYIINLGEDLPTVLNQSSFAKYFDSSYTVKLYNPTTITATTTQVVVSVTDGNTTGYATFTLVHDPLVYTVDTTATGYTTVITGDNNNTIDLGNNKVTVLTPALMASYIKYDSKYKAIKVTVKTTITDSTQAIIVKIENNYETAFETFNILVNTDLDLTVAKNDSQYSPTPTSGSTIGNEYDIALNGRKPTDILFSELEKTIKDKNGAVLTITPLTNVTDKTGEIYVMASTPHSSAIVKFNLVDDSLSYKVDFGNLEFNVTENAKHDAKYDKSFTIDLGKNSADAIKDYSAFITDVTAGGTVTVLSDTSKDDCHEVVVAVQKGEEIEYVQFILDTTSGTTTSLSWLIWVLLGAAILLLGVILVVVNKDKYGKIAKSRRR